MNTGLMKFLSCVTVKIVILFPVILIHHHVANSIQIPTHELNGSQFLKFCKKKQRKQEKPTEGGGENTAVIQLKYLFSEWKTKGGRMGGLNYLISKSR